MTGVEQEEYRTIVGLTRGFADLVKQSYHASTASLARSFTFLRKVSMLRIRLV